MLSAAERDEQSIDWAGAGAAKQQQRPVGRRMERGGCTGSGGGCSRRPAMSVQMCRQADLEARLPAAHAQLRRPCADDGPKMVETMMEAWVDFCACLIVKRKTLVLPLQQQAARRRASQASACCSRAERIKYCRCAGWVRRAGTLGIPDEPCGQGVWGSVRLGIGFSGVDCVPPPRDITPATERQARSAGVARELCLSRRGGSPLPRSP